MHIAEGLLSLGHAAVWTAAAIPPLVLGVRSVRRAGQVPAGSSRGRSAPVLLLRDGTLAFDGPAAAARAPELLRRAGLGA